MGTWRESALGIKKGAEINNKINLSPVYTYAYCVNKDKGIDSQTHRKQHPSTQVHKMCINTDTDKIRHLQFRQAF